MLGSYVSIDKCSKPEKTVKLNRQKTKTKNNMDVLNHKFNDKFDRFFKNMSKIFYNSKQISALVQNTVATYIIMYVTLTGVNIYTHT